MEPSGVDPTESAAGISHAVAAETATHLAEEPADTTDREHVPAAVVVLPAWDLVAEALVVEDSAVVDAAAVAAVEDSGGELAQFQ